MEKLKSKIYPIDSYRYEAGEVIIREGQASSVIYILLKGLLGIYKGGKKVSQIREAGTIFGEMSSILRKARTCTVKAERESEVLVYRGGIDGILVKFPSVTRKVMKMLAERLNTLDEDYSRLLVEYDAVKAELERTKLRLAEALSVKVPRPQAVEAGEPLEDKMAAPEADHFQTKISQEELDQLMAKGFFRKGFVSKKMK